MSNFWPETCQDKQTFVRQKSHKNLATGHQSSCQLSSVFAMALTRYERTWNQFWHEMELILLLFLLALTTTKLSKINLYLHHQVYLSQPVHAKIRSCLWAWQDQALRRCHLQELPAWNRLVLCLVAPEVAGYWLLGLTIANFGWKPKSFLHTRHESVLFRKPLPSFRANRSFVVLSVHEHGMNKKRVCMCCFRQDHKWTCWLSRTALSPQLWSTTMKSSLIRLLALVDHDLPEHQQNNHQQIRIGRTLQPRPIRDVERQSSPNPVGLAQVHLSTQTQVTTYAATFVRLRRGKMRARDSS